MRARRSVALALAGVLAAAHWLPAATGTRRTRTPAAGGTATVLNVGMPNGPQTENHNPFLGTSAGASLGLPLDDLRAAGDEQRASSRPSKGKPWLATEWAWSDNFTKVTLTIRDGATWSDGKPMTADDVAYTFQLRKDNEGLNTDAIPYGSDHRRPATRST